MSSLFLSGRNWVIALQEYDLEFKPDTIIKGQGFCKFLAESHTNEDHDVENEDELNLIDVCTIFTTPESWYNNLLHYIQQGYLLEHWNLL